jgi:hypothetical protein
MAGEEVSHLRRIVELDVAEFVRLLALLKHRLSGQATGAGIPHLEDILTKIDKSTVILQQARSSTLMSHAEFRKMFQGFIVPVEGTRYKDGIVRRMMDRFHRNTILALQVGGRGHVIEEGVKLWKSLQNQYYHVLQLLEDQWEALGLLAPEEARRQARNSQLSVQVNTDRRQSGSDVMTVCTVGSGLGEVSFRLDGIGSSEVLSTFLGESGDLEVLQEELERLVKSVREARGQGSVVSSYGTEESVVEDTDNTVTMARGWGTAYRRNSC